MFKSKVLKVCAVLAVVFAGAVRLPAAEEVKLTAEEVQIRSIYANSMTKAIAKGASFSGKQVSPEQQAEIRRIVNEAFPEILATVKRAGLYEEYKAQMFDPELRSLDERAMAAKDMGEVMSIARQQMAVVQKKYPELFKWMNSNKELQAVVSAMMQKIIAVLK